MTIERRLAELERRSTPEGRGPVALIIGDDEPLPDNLPVGSILIIRERIVNATGGEDADARDTA